MKRSVSRPLIIIATVLVCVLVFLWIRSHATPPALDPEGPPTPDPRPIHPPEGSTRPASFLFLSDIHLDGTHQKTRYDVHDDTGWDVWKAFMAKTDSVLRADRSIGFVLFTGDLAAHYGKGRLHDGQKAAHNANIRPVLDSLRALTARNNRPLFYVPGNNDAIAGNYYPFYFGTNDPTPFTLVDERKDPYPAPHVKPGTGTPPCLIDLPDTSLCYYSAYPVAGLRLIVLNTVMYTQTFYGVALDPLAPGNAQMAWLKRQLADAQAKDEDVYIAMHVPPGIDAYGNRPTWVGVQPGQDSSFADQFLSLVCTYQDSTLRAVLYGHTHMDEFRLFKSAANSTVGVAISDPAVSPYYGNNPAFKTVQFDPGSKAITDFTTYYTTLPVGSWGNRSYTFSTIFQKKNAALSIRDHLAAMDPSVMVADLAKIFMVRRTTPNWFQNGIYVQFGQGTNGPR